MAEPLTKEELELALDDLRALMSNAGRDEDPKLYDGLVRLIATFDEKDKTIQQWILWTAELQEVVAALELVNALVGAEHDQDHEELDKVAAQLKETQRVSDGLHAAVLMGGKEQERLQTALTEVERRLLATIDAYEWLLEEKNNALEWFCGEDPVFSCNYCTPDLAQSAEGANVLTHSKDCIWSPGKDALELTLEDAPGAKKRARGK